MSRKCGFALGAIMLTAAALGGELKIRAVRRGAKIVDLGAAPGGWTQIAVERCGENNVLGVDLQPIDPIEGAELLELDFMKDEAPGIIREKL